jgi:type VI secretion system protein ImpA
MLDIESLLAPIADDAPCGSDLQYDPAFREMETAGAGKPERQYGDKVFAAEPPDWRAVQEQARELATRTRDLRIAVWLVRAGARLEGLQGAADGLGLVHGLLERHWSLVHPQLDAEEGNDPTMRLSALAPLASTSGMLSGAPVALDDLREATLTGDRGSITLRQIELGVEAKADPEGDESRPTEAGVIDAVRAALGRQPGLLDAMQAAARHLDGVACLLEDQVGTVAAPDLAVVRRLLKAVAKAAALASGQGVQAQAADSTSPDAAASSVAPPAAAGGAVAVGAIASREDVVRTLERACEWIERHEPSNPAPLLIRRAQRLMSKNFMEIMRDLAPDGLDQIQRLAGVTDNDN